MPDNTSSPDSPSAPTDPTSPDLFDKENAFLLYAVFCGNVTQTAHALGVGEKLVADVAIENKWDQRLRPIIELKNSTKPGDVERAVNRAMNFVQAHRYRLFLERVLREMTGLSQQDIRAYMLATDVDKDGVAAKKFNTRALADFASALEKCQSMTYLALNDTATDRKERGEDNASDAAAAEMHLRLADAMAKAGGPSMTPKGMLLDYQLSVAEHEAVPVK